MKKESNGSEAEPETETETEKKESNGSELAASLLSEKVNYLFFTPFHLLRETRSERLNFDILLLS